MNTTCPSCGRPTSVNGPTHHTSPGHITQFHLTEIGTICPSAGRPITVEAAQRRDDRLNPAEEAVRDAIWHRETACKGHDTITGERCHHPVCHREKK